MKAVILAGGLGTRLQPYTTFIPKPMLPLGEKPLLEHLIEWVKKNGAEKFIGDTFVCIYGDSVFDFNLKNMISDHRKKKSFITMSLYEYKTNMKYGVIDTKNNGRVSAWNEKPEIKAKINMGCYVMEPSILGFIPKNKPYGMDDVIKKAISKRKNVNT